MTELPRQLYRADQVRELDRIAIEAYGIPGAVLMERAGRAAFARLRARWPGARHVTVICGVGNNAGDGFVLARLAREAGLTVTVLQVDDGARLRGDALAAQQRLQAAGVAVQPFAPARLQAADVLVDALFGTGLDRPLAGAWRAAVEAINAAPMPVLSLDIPSGLHADTGTVLGAAVRAALTVTFIGLKLGMFLEAGPVCCGEILYDDLGVPAAAFERVQPAGFR